MVDQARHEGQCQYSVYAVKPHLHEGSDTAQVYITRQLQRHPTMRVFHKLMDYHLNDAEEGRAKESLMVLRDMVGEQAW